APRPEGVEPHGFRDLADWLDFLDIRAATSLRVIGKWRTPPADVSPAVLAAVAAARKRWRDDVVGFQNGPLLVLSPPERPGAIARSLTLGRMVCDALDAAFASTGARRADDEVLVLELYPNRSEYLVHGAAGE